MWLTVSLIVASFPPSTAGAAHPARVSRLADARVRRRAVRVQRPRGLHGVRTPPQGQSRVEASEDARERGEGGTVRRTLIHQPEDVFGFVDGREDRVREPDALRPCEVGAYLDGELHGARVRVAAVAVDVRDALDGCRVADDERDDQGGEQGLAAFESAAERYAESERGSDVEENREDDNGGEMHG